MGKHTHLKALRPDTVKKVYEYRMHENVFLHTSVMQHLQCVGCSMFLTTWIAIILSTIIFIGHLHTSVMQHLQCVGCSMFLTTWIAIILSTIIFDWPFGNKSPVPELSKYWPMGFYLAVSLQYFITMSAPNTGPWASIRKKTAKQKPMSLY